MEEVARWSDEFDSGYAAGQLSVAEFAAVVERSLPVLHRIDEVLELDQDEVLRRIEANMEDSQALQKAHREFVLRLEELNS